MYIPGEHFLAAALEADPVPTMLERIEASLERLGVHFDVWTTEASLHDNGWVDRAIERLRGGGHVYDQDGALWFRSMAFGEQNWYCGSRNGVMG